MACILSPPRNMTTPCSCRSSSGSQEQQGALGSPDELATRLPGQYHHERVLAPGGKKNKSGLVFPREVEWRRVGVGEGAKGFKGVKTMTDVHVSHLVTVMDGGNDLSEEASGLALTQASAFADVVVQLALAGVLHHDHDLVLVLEH